jgi:hypothetical protein
MFKITRLGGITACALAFTTSAPVSAAVYETSTGWYDANFSNGTCEGSQFSPEHMRQYIRSEGRTELTRVTRDQTGAVSMVEIEDITLSGAMYFVRDPTVCEKFMQQQKDSGVATDPAELQ